MDQAPPAPPIGLYTYQLLNEPDSNPPLARGDLEHTLVTTSVAWAVSVATTTLVTVSVSVTVLDTVEVAGDVTAMLHAEVTSSAG